MLGVEEYELRWIWNKMHKVPNTCTRILYKLILETFSTIHIGGVLASPATYVHLYIRKCMVRCICNHKRMRIKEICSGFLAFGRVAIFCSGRAYSIELFNSLQLWVERISLWKSGASTIHNLILLLVDIVKWLFLLHHAKPTPHSTLHTYL